MLSSGGVGYFEYETELDGSATLGLDIPLDEIDDVLKSLVVFDSAGGVGSIELPGRDESATAFGDIPLDANSFGSALAYLNGLQGIEISVSGSREMTGRILRAETVTTEIAGHDGGPAATVPRTRVTLITADGLRQFILEDADAVQVADPKLRAGIGRALDQLHRAAAHDTRHVTLHVAGTEHRIVRVGYVVGAPLWKTTYRLVLPAKDSATLQAWAVLENQSGVDWNGVELTLQSGNPVTFRQALYQSYFVDRPEVPVEVFNRILPPEDTRAYAMAKNMDAAVPPPPFAPPPDFKLPPREGEARRSGSLSFQMAPAQDAAETTEASEAVLFRLPKPVSLAAGHSASVPLIDRQAKAEAVDLIQDVATHPLASVKLTNDTGSGLPPGVLTLYSPGASAFFAGDARIGAVPVGETRLLSFAQDLHVSVDWHAPETRTLISLGAAKGVLTVSSKQRTTRHITIVGAAAGPDAARTLLLAIDKPANAHLGFDGGVGSGTEETENAWRVPLAVKPGETRELIAHIDSQESRTIALTPDRVDEIVALSSADGLSPTEKAALDRLKSLQHAVADADNHQRDLSAMTKALDADEGRIRDNLRAVASSDAMHTRLLKQLEADEDQIATTRRDLSQAEEDTRKARSDLADAVTSLTL
jgi:hypothetical protein